MQDFSKTFRHQIYSQFAQKHIYSDLFNITTMKLNTFLKGTHSFSGTPIKTLFFFYTLCSSWIALTMSVILVGILKHWSLDALEESNCWSTPCNIFHIPKMDLSHQEMYQDWWQLCWNGLNMLSANLKINLVLTFFNKTQISRIFPTQAPLW